MPSDGCDSEGCDLDDDYDPNRTWIESDGTIVEALVNTDVNPVGPAGPNVPYRTRITLGGIELGWNYFMAAGSLQSSVSSTSTRYRIGRFLAAMGIGLDIVETVLTVEPGASVAPGYLDGFVTYFSGAFTGDNYIPGVSIPPSYLPSDMVSINQDALWNFTEAIIPILSAKVLGVSGLIAGLATAVPGDELFYAGGGALTAYAIVDAITSGGSAIYDYGRFTGDLKNHLTVGYSPENGLLIVHWP